MEFCRVCKGPLRSGRKPPYCSKKCEARVEGYSEAHARSLERIAQRVSASLGFRPDPPSPIERVVSGYPIMVFSDIHAKLHSERWIMQGLSVAEKFQSKVLIVNGDFIDANEISKHAGSYFKRGSSLEDDFKAGELLLDVFSKYFEQVIFLNGNHCGQRLIKALGGEVAMQRLWKMFGEHANVKVTPRSYVYVNDDVIVGHPRQYSKIRGNTAQKIAQMKQKHILLGHSHHSAMAITPDGKWQACEVGCMAELEQFDYVNFEINDMAEPVNGFAVVTGNQIQCFDKFTKWELFGLENHL